jgi:hypothetical protein
MGLGAVVIQKTAPLELMSSNLLYCRCTSHVFDPTVILSASPLQISPFSSLNGPHRIGTHLDEFMTRDLSSTLFLRLSEMQRAKHVI